MSGPATRTSPGSALPASGPAAAALAGLIGAHLTAVPFENLSIHLGEPISLDEADLVDKIVGAAARRLLLRAQRRVRRCCCAHSGYDVTCSPPGCTATSGPGRSSTT